MVKKMGIKIRALFHIVVALKKILSSLFLHEDDYQKKMSQPKFEGYVI